MITVDLEKARAITKTRLRAERAIAFEPLDVQFQRNLETATDNTTVIAEKQRLRDITKLADSATTLADLKAITVT